MTEKEKLEARIAELKELRDGWQGRADEASGYIAKIVAVLPRLKAQLANFGASILDNEPDSVTFRDPETGEPISIPKLALLPKPDVEE